VGVCAHGATTSDDCELPNIAYADADGTASLQVHIPSSLETAGGATIDCTVGGACELAAWDARDFSTLATAPLRIAPEVPGTLTVTPSTGLHDGDSVTLTGSGWPADQYLELDEC